MSRYCYGGTVFASWFVVAFVLLYINLTNVVFNQLDLFDFQSPVSSIYPGRSEFVVETDERYPTRKEVQHIAFLKVHKAASSTAQNIFLRFGWYRNLTFVLSPAHNPYGFPNIISLRQSLTNSNILPPPDGHHYDILCNHVLYSHENFSRFMPNDTVYIGILREPFELYKSILNYFRPRYIYKKINDSFPASVFLRNPSKYEPKDLFGSWTNSRMAFEYGFPKELFTNYNKVGIGNYLNKLAKEFTLILIAENMDESVVLMRRYLNWKTKDIIYLNLNVATKKNETILSKVFDREFYKSYAKIDYDLYGYFYKRLKEQIRLEGEDFDEEILQFKELRKNVQEYCHQQESNSPLHVPATRWSDTFNVTKADCTELMRGELSFIRQIRIRQFGSEDI